jgi:hypothetical protein
MLGAWAEKRPGRDSRPELQGDRRSALGGERDELGCQVLGAAVERGEVLVIGLGDFDAVALAKLHDDIEEIHTIELKLIAEADFRFHIRKVFVGRDISDDVEYDLFAFVFGHGAVEFGIRRQSV